MIIGITGSSGAGKSTVCEILENTYNYYIISADELARELSKKGTKYLNEIVKEFGNEILLNDGELNRKKLANIIYANENKRNDLNTITFKYIRKEIKELVKKTNNNNVAIDAPLLLEAELASICDYTVAVIVENRKIQIQRIIKRDKIEEEHAIARINAQHSNEFYVNKCDYVIVNNDKIEQQVEELIKKLNKNVIK